MVWPSCLQSVSKLLAFLQLTITRDPERLCGGRDRTYSNFSGIMRCSYDLLTCFSGDAHQVSQISGMFPN